MEGLALIVACDNMGYSILKGYKFIPVVVFKDIQEVAPKLQKLQAGNINIAEITFRTDCAEQAIKFACKEYSNMLIGAGTIINSQQCEKAIKCGAKFIVSPGFDKGVLEVCNSHGILYVPGVATPTEIISAINSGLQLLKFFPCDLYGGLKALKTFHSVFPNVKFMPTGGIDMNNMAEFLQNDYIVAIGGSFVMNGDIVENCKKINGILEEVK